MADLKDALKHNREGHESLREKCVNAPKYGCDDKYADNWCKEVLDCWFGDWNSTRQHTVDILSAA